MSMQDSKYLFKDPLNPTKEELKTWAYGDYYEPVQDFKLMVTDDPLYALSFAIDQKCKTKDFFLSSLYVFVGDSVRNKEDNRQQLDDLLMKASSYDDNRIRKFVERSKHLIENPASYNYADWGLGENFSKE